MQKFCRALQQEDWEKWYCYAHKVRMLQLDDDSPFPGSMQLEASVYDEISRTRPSPRNHLLPNLRYLTWWATSAERQIRSMAFMHSNINTLSLRFFDDATHPLSNYVEYIAKRVPHLIKLEVLSDAPMHHIQDGILSLLSRTSQLKALVVPMYFLTDVAMTALAILPSLETIEFTRPTEGGTGDRADVANFHPILLDGAFPSLKKLSFSAHLQHATDFANLPFTPSRLSSIHLQVLAIDNPPVLERYFYTVVAQYGQLTALYIDFVLAPGAVITPLPPPLAARPNFETIKPLLACRNLRTFELRWDYQLHILEKNMEDLATSWPLLEVLLLNSDAIPEIDPPALSPLALLPFAEHCLHLRELSINIDGNKAPPTVPLATLPFQVLSKLALGSSPIDQVDPMAIFLSCICPMDCQLVAGVRWPDAYGIALDQARVTGSAREDMSIWWNKWTLVGKALPLAIKARQDERDKMTKLIEGEADRWGVQVAELEHELRELQKKIATGKDI
ncbi:hypothetical protein EIP86_007547 [Pleurotus ostreatoroseus]|nr:hypothetical protein EIP86_007547 [Pleurotus ostreatoroseus]